ncbi:hypothetical protein S101446_03352 (plasmid) [Komagataeibacter europaeus]|nr:hypothetical protein S101446_03352 [Komagataeibacter europaeus]
MFRETAAASEPYEAMLHDPAFRHDDEAFSPIAALDDLDRPSATFDQHTTQLLASISTLTNQMAQPSEQ